jgi:hypothetical protein
MDLYIKNQSNEDISINSIVAFDGYKVDSIHDLIIKNKQTHLLLKCESIIDIDKSDIPVYLKQLNIKKEGKNVNFNTIDTNRWDCEVISTAKPFAKSLLHIKSTLTINPEDFEDK